MKDETFMKAAIREAERASKIKEVPIGAVAVLHDKIIARAHNLRECTKNPLGHAELLLLQKIVRKKNKPPSWRFDEIDVYVTCEPCFMCMGALIQSRIRRLVFGCHDPKGGACGSVADISAHPKLNHRIEVVKGILSDECGDILSEFFRELRAKIR